MVTKWRDWLPDWRGVLKIISYVALLYVLQAFVIMPFMRYALDLDFFPKTGSFEAVSEEGAQVAQLECGEYFRHQMDSRRVEFPAGTDKVWRLGDGRYLIKSSAIVTDSAGLSSKLNYACYIQYLGGDVFDSHNWKLKGLDWRPDGQS